MDELILLIICYVSRILSTLLCSHEVNEDGAESQRWYSSCGLPNCGPSTAALPVPLPTTSDVAATCGLPPGNPSQRHESGCRCVQKGSVGPSTPSYGRPAGHDRACRGATRALSVQLPEEEDIEQYGQGTKRKTREDNYLIFMNLRDASITPKIQPILS